MRVPNPALPGFLVVGQFDVAAALRRHLAIPQARDYSLFAPLGQFPPPRFVLIGDSDGSLASPKAVQITTSRQAHRGSAALPCGKPPAFRPLPEPTSFRNHVLRKGQAFPQIGRRSRRSSWTLSSGIWASPSKSRPYL